MAKPMTLEEFLASQGEYYRKELEEDPIALSIAYDEYRTELYEAATQDVLEADEEHDILEGDNDE